MTVWVPLIRRQAPQLANFTGLVPVIAEPEFQNLQLAKPETTTGLQHTESNSYQPSHQEMPGHFENTSHRILELEETAAQLTAEVKRLHAELDRIAKAHEVDQEAMTETFSATLLRQHKSLIEDVKNTLAECTANVLRPILNAAASDAASRDFKRIIGDLADGTIFSIKTSEPQLQRLGETLGPHVKIILCDPDDNETSVNIGKEVITSCLAEWSQTIAGNNHDE